MGAKRVIAAVIAAVALTASGTACTLKPLPTGHGPTKPKPTPKPKPKPQPAKPKPKPVLQHPGLPQIISGAAKEDTYTMSWKPGSGGAATSWRVSRDGNDSRGTGPWSGTLGAGARSITFTVLIPGDTYNFRVLGLNAAGQSASDVVTVTIPKPTTVVPPPPPVSTDPVFHITKAYVYTYKNSNGTTSSTLNVDVDVTCANGSAYRFDAASATEGIAYGSARYLNTGPGSGSNCYKNFGSPVSITPATGSVNFVAGGPVTINLAFKTFPYGQEDSPFIKTWYVSTTLANVCTDIQNSTGQCPSS